MNFISWLPDTGWQARLYNAAASTAIVLALIVSVYVVASTAVFLWYGPIPPAAPLAEVTTAPAGISSRAVPATDLAGLNLFGDPAAGANAQPPTLATNAPETRLRITLIGVFVAADPRSSVAIIAYQDQEQRYQTGDLLPGNSTLVEIHRDHVVLRRGTGHERLSFERSDLDIRRSSLAADGDGTATDVADPGAVTAPETGAGDARPGGRTSNLSGSHGRRGNRSPAALARDYAERFVAAPEQTLTEVGIEPVILGSATGYRLAAVASAAELARVGLRPNDVVLSINGQTVGNPQVDTGIIEQVRNARSARLEIQRGEQRFIVTMPIPRD